eukprot:TRINITY_DN12159_c0_g1_i1.p1 TRINITY_DN12159_c0_g1~~TRINITY_DN12159_c0_g1_i1.p1  ORF type:complete len:117 (-),score=24.45 TRINITY_DN12159_c0_g1_i1:307-657(-)
MPSVVSRSSIVLLLSLAVLGLGQRQRGGGGVERVRRQPTSLARHRSDSYRNNANTQERGKGGLAELLAGILPNTYYSRPKYRYPYYDNTGKGQLLYGYGGKDLYEYSVFKPLEGYF